MRFRLLVSLLALTAIASASSFDKPLRTQTVDLGPSRYSMHTHGKVTCYLFPHFMVKEVDLGQKGADKLAIVPIANGVAASCTAARAKSEMIVRPHDWSGYFKGVKNNLVFFRADDGLNGGMGFAIYDAKTGKKIFEDVALGQIEFVEHPGKLVAMNYTRVIDAECILPKEQAACWERIAKKIALSAGMLDCKKGYDESARNLAKGRCQAQSTDTPECLEKELKLATEQTAQAPSVIAYPVEVTLGPHPNIKAVPGSVRCWPSE